MTIIEMKKEEIRTFLPDRHIDSHKGDYGRVLFICGSKCYTGAPYFATMGALRTGTGLAYLAVPECIHNIVPTKMHEPVIYGLPDENGMLSEKALPEILNLLKGKDAVLIGPGLGQSAGTKAVVSAVLMYANCPVVLDADGINVMKAHKDILRGRKGATILTPHVGEFERFAFAIGEDRLLSAAKLADELGAIVVLKGHRTVTTDGETCYINTTGNPGMATGGSGDILAGIIAGLIGQGFEPLKAAALGVCIHGAAGDLCASEIGTYGMLPTDMLSALPRLMK